MQGEHGAAPPTPQQVSDAVAEWTRMKLEYDSLHRQTYEEELAGGAALSAAGGAPAELLDTLWGSYQKLSLAEYLGHMKALLYASDQPLQVIRDRSTDWAHVCRQLRHLSEQGVVSIAREDGSLKLLKPHLLHAFPEPKSPEQVREALEARLGPGKLRTQSTVNALLGQLGCSFDHKSHFDQLSISQGSIIDLISRILTQLPLRGPFLCVGDDDFVGFLLKLCDPSVQVTVADADESVRTTTKQLAEAYDLDITTAAIDVAKPEFLGSYFVSFLCNPVYTERGVQLFMSFGAQHLDPSIGGSAFLELGDEIIGRRLLFLQRWWAEHSFLVRDVLRAAVHYPVESVHSTTADGGQGEDAYQLAELAKLMDPKALEDAPRLGASLYVFDWFPESLEHVKQQDDFEWYCYM